MKNFSLLIISFFLIQIVSAQEQSSKALDKIYQLEEVDIKPEYPGGIMEFYKFIAKNYKTPEVEGLNGKIIVAFIIEIDGSLSNVVALQDIGYGTGKSAVDVVKKSEKWISATMEGKQVRVAYKIPITMRSSRR